MNIEFLSKILAIQTYPGQEAPLVAFLTSYCKPLGYTCHVDSHGNLFVSKGLNSTDKYPIVCAHTDTVHKPQKVSIVEQNGRLVAYDEDGYRAGLGGDDKAGVYICLELLASSTALKAVFFASEESGCKGSSLASSMWFHDVAYCLGWDAPGGVTMSLTCDDIPLFDAHGEFIKAVEPILWEHGVTQWKEHYITDVAKLRQRFGFPCLNLPCGYYNEHSSNESVRIADVKKAIELGNDLLAKLGYGEYDAKKLATLPA